MVLLHSLALPMGTPIIDFTLPGVDGKTHNSSDYVDAKILVVIFMCNHCPYVQGVIDRLIAIQTDYAGKGVQLVGINSNDSNQYPDDSFEAMQKWAAEKGMNFPYLVDESQQVARAYQAQCTPDIYVFDQSRMLAYHGRIDDNWQHPDQITRHELRDALETILAGGHVSPHEQISSMGCSIKWKKS